MHAIGIDIGGTKIAGGVVSADGQILTQSRIDTPAGEEVIDAVTHMIAELSVGYDPVAVGIAIPGFVDLTRETVRIAPNISGWVDVPVARLFAERTALPVLIDNDVNAAGWAEHRFGAGQGVSHMTMLTIGTGLGGAIIASGEVFRGGFGSAAELGHMCVHPGGLDCSCGARGCLEAEASGTAIEAITGRSPTEPTYEIMQRTGRLVGTAVASVCNLLDLDLAVVGGSVALGFGATFFNSAQEALDESARMAYSRGARITPVRLGDRGPLVGAGAVAIRGLRRSGRHSS